MKGKGEKGHRSSFGSSQTEDGTLSFTTLKPFDYAKACPLFTSISTRDEDDYISMDEVDNLQPELESILSSMSKRVKALQAEIQNLSSSLERGKDKLGSSPSGTLTPQSTGSMSSSAEHNHTGAHKRSGKGKSTEERPAKRMRTDSGRATYAQPVSSKGKSKNHSDNSEGTSTKMPKNITPGRFWAMVEPYCSEITREDLRFLEEQIKFCEDIGDVVKIPPLGRYYGEEWDEENLGTEQAEDKKKGVPKNSVPAVNFDKSHGDQDEASSLYGPLTQRLIQALLEVGDANNDHDFLISDADAYEAATIPPRHLAKQLHIENPCDLEKRIKRELHEQGILDSDDSDDNDNKIFENGCKPGSDSTHNNNNNNSNQEDEEKDEVLLELRRKQNELKNLSSQNCQVLRELLKMGREEMVRQELRKKLAAADTEVEEAYKKLQTYKQRKKTPSKKEKDTFFRAIQDRKVIAKQLHRSENHRSSD